ncbi:MAG: hypothetical protein V1650_00920 [Candidatus Omnitrophota bacterium]
MGDTVMILLEPARVMLSQIGQFSLNLLLVIVILLIGWLIARLIKGIVIKAFVTLKLDDLAKEARLPDFLSRGGIKYSFSELIGAICYWLVILVTLMVAMNALGLTVAAQLLDRVILYIPNIIAAIFIITVGMFVAVLLRNIVMTTAANAGLSQSKTLAKIVEVIVMVFAVLMSLEQLNIAAATVDKVITITLGSLGLAFAIAVGFGGRDMAEKIISDISDKLKKK